MARWLGPDDAQLERAAVYTFHSVAQEGWRKGRLLLAGDACHQTPPFLGQGMCAGIRDAANLAWKLSAIIRDGAPDALLDTYESERLPHVRTFIDLAVRLGAVLQETDRAAAAARDRRFEASAEMFDFPQPQLGPGCRLDAPLDRKSTRLNSSHANISYAVFCLKKKKEIRRCYQYPTNNVQIKT